jgi:hypothetical protein
MRKNATLLLIAILTVSSLIMVGSAFAQSAPKPSVPEFTVEFVDRSYDVPVTYTTSTDPFTGQPVTTSSGGNHVTNRTIDVKIKNQPYSKVNTENGNVVQLYYAVRTKGHFTDWTPVASGGYSFTRVLASTSDYTVVTLVIGSENDILMGYADVVIPDGGQEDFQVNAQAGYEYLYGRNAVIFGTKFETVEESGWSSTQTITLGEGQAPVSSPASTPTPTAPNMGPTSPPSQEPLLTQEQLEMVAGVAVAVAVLSAGLGLLIYLIKRK